VTTRVEKVHRLRDKEDASVVGLGYVAVQQTEGDNGLVDGLGFGVGADEVASTEHE
jgi:hypothetical protein